MSYDPPEEQHETFSKIIEKQPPCLLKVMSYDPYIDWGKVRLFNHSRLGFFNFAVAGFRTS